MAKEKFLIVAVRQLDDCFSRFSETENRKRIADGTADASDPYSWIEATFEIQLRRHREATHLCSFTPSAYYIWLQNYFVGTPNDAWLEDGDPENLERENGGEYRGYGTYRDDYDSDYICDTFTIDTVRDLGLRKPSERQGPEAAEAYHSAIWKAAEEAAHEYLCNGVDAPILWVERWREKQREAARAERKRRNDDARRAIENLRLLIREWRTLPLRQLEWAWQRAFGYRDLPPRLQVETAEFRDGLYSMIRRAQDVEKAREVA